MTTNIPHIVTGNINLLLLADILDNADAKHIAAGEPTYDQTDWAHDCGTPACAIGHWQAFKGRRVRPENDDLNRCAHEFSMDIGSDEWAKLFGYKPGYARSASEAAEKIRKFVTTRSAERSAS
jgi:hypothetical protein